MERIRYPAYEVVFVDDGSTDNTQEILIQFPWVKNIRQKNMGLSFARNVGMEAATGEVIVYTDSDCEADDDWIYFLALGSWSAAAATPGWAGQIWISDEAEAGSPIVSASRPAGTDHARDDRRSHRPNAHVPGCNMAFYKWVKFLSS